MEVLCAVVLLFIGSSAALSRDIAKYAFPRNIIPRKSFRLFGANTAVDGQFPYMAFVQYQVSDVSTLSCGGALVTAEFVITAAHCFPNNIIQAETTLVLAGKANLTQYFGPTGDYDVQERFGSKVWKNPFYDSNTNEHDFALIRVDKPFNLNAKVQTLPIAREQLRSRTSCTIQGWGLREGDMRAYELMFANDVNAKSVSEGCAYKSKGPFICLEKSRAGICQGDSGSPLVCGGSIWGVASHILSTAKNPTCGDDVAEFYADVYPELEWLDSVLQSWINLGDEIVHDNDGDSGATSLNSFSAVLVVTIFAACLS